MKKSVFKLILFNFLVVLVSYKVNSQVINNFGTEVFAKIITPSPNAASLGNYGNYNVDMFSGQPSISINLHAIKSTNAVFPINLNYNLSSIKPDEHPSWVGLGWNINVGGSITRLVKGGVDEVMVSDYTDPTIFSYYDHFDRLNSDNWDSDSKLQEYASYLTSVGPSGFIAYPAPDEFVFNVNGLSGSFFKNHLGNWVLKSNQNIDIKIKDSLYYDFHFYDLHYNTIQYPQDFSIKRIIYGFELTDVDGTKYIFGNEKNAIEFGSYYNNTADGFHPNIFGKTWYLTKVIFPNKEVITFKYKTAVDSPHPDAEHQDAYFNKAVYRQHTSNNYLEYSYTSDVYNQEQNQISKPLHKSLERMYLVYLDSIIGKDFKIKFKKSLSNEMDYNTTMATEDWVMYNSEYDAQNYGAAYASKKHWYKLDSIIIKNYKNELFDKITFTYLENSNSRLFLNEVRQFGTSNTNPKTYTFEYNQTPLPPYNSGKTDHWGFYNNSLYTGSWSKTQLINNFYASKNPNFTYLQAGVLTSIFYPTGGVTSFIYEPHNYSKRVLRDVNGFSVIYNNNNQNEIAGGLRIKEILSKNSVSDTQFIKKEYLYVNDYLNGDNSSSGVLSGIPDYFEEYNTSINSDFAFKLIDNPTIFLNDTNGNHVTYSKIIEKNQNNSYTEFTFSNHDNVVYLDQVPNNTLKYSFAWISGPFVYFPLNSVKTLFNKRDTERGKLLFEKKYDEFNHYVEQVKYYYNTPSVTNSLNEIRSLDFTESLFGDEIVDQGLYKYLQIDFFVGELSTYKVLSNHSYLEKIEKSVYQQNINNFILHEDTYSYTNLTDLHQLKTSSTRSSLNNELILKQFSYPIEPEMQSLPGVNCMISNNLIGVPIKTEIFNVNEKLSEVYTEYFSPSSDLCLPKYVFTKKGDEISIPLEKKITYDLYDNKGNLKQFTIENAPPVSIIWGYYQTQPIAKIEGVAYINLPTPYLNAAISASNTGTESELVSALNALRMQIPNAMISTYTYKPLIGVSTITDPKGDTQYYFYDNFNRLQYVKDKDSNILSENQYHYRPIVE